MLPVVAGVLPKMLPEMLPTILLSLNSVTDVADFPRFIHFYVFNPSSVSENR